MAGKSVKNLVASVHGLLLSEARRSGRPFNELLQYFAMERFLYRLSRSPSGGRFVLKGALMIPIWQAPLFRPTRDIDLLGRMSNSINAVTSAIKEACRLAVEPDGMTFDAESVTATRITQDAHYEGIRVRLVARLGNARIPLQIDIGFGDVVVPGISKITYPTILDFPPPLLNGYTPESTIAEKLQAMVELGSLNSRMKDFYDIWLLSRRFNFDGQILATAIRKTFENRKTVIPSRLMVLRKIAEDPEKKSQWRAFVKKTKLNEVPGSFIDIVSTIVRFLEPVLAALVAHEDFEKRWRAAGPWR